MKTIIFVLAAGVLMLTGCSESRDSKDIDPSFLPGCFRKETVSATFSIPEMDDPREAAYLQQVIKGQPGYVDSRSDLQNRTITIDYSSSLIRRMNFEEAIALAGFSVNGRPANPNAKIPAGVN
ncbi:MAG TPA: hypothetical protein VIR77_00480 [Pontiella sp.]